MKFEILKICSGKAKDVNVGDKTIHTAYLKTPITEPTHLNKLGLVGDEHVYKLHGGVDKAICLYDKDDYALWESYIPNMPEYSAFGENITTRGLTKDNIAIGDTFKLGEGIIQVTESRGPCNTIAQIHGVPDIVKMILAKNATGCYFRVLKEGTIHPGDALELIERHPVQFTIDEFNTLKYHEKKNKALLEKALLVDALPLSHKEKFQSQLEKL